MHIIFIIGLQLRNQGFPTSVRFLSQSTMVSLSIQPCAYSKRMILNITTKQYIKISSTEDPYLTLTTIQQPLLIHTKKMTKNNKFRRQDGMAFVFPLRLFVETVK